MQKWQDGSCDINDHYSCHHNQGGEITLKMVLLGNVLWMLNRLQLLYTVVNNV